MNRHDDYKDIETEMKSMPKLKLDESKQQNIHRSIMEEVDKVDRKHRRGDLMKRIFVGLSSAAALVLIVGLAFSFKTGDSNLGADDPESEPELNEEHAPDPNEVQDQNENQITDVYSEYNEILDGNIIKIVGNTGPSGNGYRYTSQDQDLIQSFKESLKTIKIDQSHPQKERGGTRLYFELFDQDNQKVFIMNITEDDILDIDNEFLSIIDSGIQDFTSTFFTDQYLNETMIEPVLTERAKSIVKALEEKSMEEIAQFVHPTKGILFSPYVYVQEDALTFDQSKVAKLLEDTTVYHWGTEDGSGYPIEMTPNEYFDKYVYNPDYKNADEILFNENTSRGNAINNIKDVFPDSHVVEFYVAGTDVYGGMDWRSLNLVFQLDEEGNYKLVGIVQDKWTS